jgi:hypothetical protein
MIGTKMTDKEYMEKASEIMKLIENSNFFKKFGYKSHWLSGSSTVVYPITDWVPSREIVIQLDSNVYRGRTQSAHALIKSVEKIMPIKYWGYGQYDGSCPPTLYMYFK